MGRRRRRGQTHPSGFVVVDKPEGLSSFEVVRRVRDAMGVRKAGHGGTLDPFATGVLPICINEATKVAELLLGAKKAYWASAELGVRTDTFDLTGEVLERREEQVEQRALEEVLERFRGEIEQRPPAFSALRVGGRRAYELARRGITPELEPRRVCIESLELRRFDWPRVELFVRCSKGTYIRSLVSDIGAALGCGAAVAALRREQSGWFTLKQAVSLEEIAAAGPSQPLISIEQALTHLPLVDVDPAQAADIGQGRELPVSAEAGDPVRVRCRGEVIAIACVADGVLRPRRVMPSIIERLGAGSI